MKSYQALLIIVVILLVDQWSKYYVKTNFILHDSKVVFDWFQILFVENDGMAWGAKLSDFIPFLSERTAKVLLTSFRIGAVIAIGFWLRNAIRDRKTRILIVALALIFAGALGNIIDSVFYGVLFSASYTEVATFLPEQGYDGLFFGNVVDMLHFPIWRGEFPGWFPFIGNEAFLFFEPVFNIADIAISTGIGMLLFFNKKVFGERVKRHTPDQA